MMQRPSLLIHVDIDSPRKLLDFYKIKGVTFDESSLEKFYAVAFERAIDFFKSNGLDATFFVVGDELDSSKRIRTIISSAFQEGFEIENHTYTHPFGLADLAEEQVLSEINKCSDVIFSITGLRPVGFRSPGYSINNRILQHLKQLEYQYDSSGFWSLMNPILSLSHKLLYHGGLKNKGFGYVTSKLPQKPYHPNEHNWLNIDSSGSLLELPLPSATIFKLPFYNNFNLWAPSLYASTVSKTITKPALVYLFHIIEFMDMTDGIPKELALHPNITKSLKTKIDASKAILENLKKRYQVTKTKEFVSKIKSHSNE
jgi:peptidoglycan-N-acetylglucosamine deacetylase